MLKFFFSILSFPLLAAAPWHLFEGCYITREVNGIKIKKEPYWNILSPSQVTVEGFLKFDVIRGKKKVNYKYKAKLEKVFCSKSKPKKKRMNILQPLIQN